MLISWEIVGGIGVQHSCGVLCDILLGDNIHNSECCDVLDSVNLNRENCCPDRARVRGSDGGSESLGKHKNTIAAMGSATV